MKPIKVDYWTELCPKCKTKVAYAVGTGNIFHGASESYEEWRYIEHKFYPNCGTKIEREDDE